MRAQKTMLLIGVTSDIGRATALTYALAGWQIIVAARCLERARREVQDIMVRTGVTPEIVKLDVLQGEQFEPFATRLSRLPDTVICVVGELGDQQRAQKDLVHAAQVLRANFEGPALLLGLFAERFASRGTGTIVGVSSVAGDRGRASNYVYGAAKAGLTAFLSGLRSRLVSSGVRVVTVKPGFVRTRMTAQMKLPAVLTAEPEEVGRAIYHAAEQSKKNIIYVRSIWRVIMTIIRTIPEPMFKRLKL
jgi:decaprenylphospho-beta-D-erythro-pentofuranosid-2-ulose 2-reductase